MTHSDKTPRPPHSDYDGHVDFSKLSPAQKLQWLASIVILAKNSKKIRAS
jgi:hypothetical protein